MPTSGDLPVTRLVEAIMDNKTSELVKVRGWRSSTLLNVMARLLQDYLYLDPKRGTTEAPKSSAPFDQAVVFMVRRLGTQERRERETDEET